MKGYRSFIILAIFILKFNTFVCAQNYTPQNGFIEESVLGFSVGFDAKIGGEDTTYSNCTIYIEGKQVKKLSKIISKNKEKAEKWADVAKREDVRNYTKILTTDGVKEDLFYYIKNGKRYGEVSFDKKYIYPVFVVDENGDCFVNLNCWVGGQTVQVDDALQFTESEIKGGILNSIEATSQSITRNKEGHMLGMIEVFIRVADIDLFVEHLNQLDVDMKNRKKSIKETDKLFK